MSEEAIKNETYYGLEIEINSEVFKEVMEDSDLEKKVEVSIEIDGNLHEMTLEEFENCLINRKTEK